MLWSCWLPMSSSMIAMVTSPEAEIAAARTGGNAGTLPAHNGLRLDDGDRATPRRQQARADEQLQPVHEIKPWALAAASNNLDLVASRAVARNTRRNATTHRVYEPDAKLLVLSADAVNHTVSPAAQVNHVFHGAPAAVARGGGGRCSRYGPRSSARKL